MKLVNLTWNLFKAIAITIGLLAAPAIVPAQHNSGHETRQENAPGIGTRNGWFVNGDRVVWGYCQHNGWWSTDIASIVRKANTVGPNRTEDIPALVENMIRYGYPCFEHTPPLWHDRRRDEHDVVCRTDANIEGPTLEFPWARSGEGQACDGGSLFDLTKFNPWYFERLAEMAAEAQRQGVIFIVNIYMQHPLLKNHAHYLDFPWRPQNTVQETGLPEFMPAATEFYASRRDLHELYIRKVLDTLKPYPETLLSLSGEYTGPLDFMEFFLDTVAAWEIENDHDVRVSLGATKDVLDAILADPERSARIDVLDLRYFWYHADGTMFDPPGGANFIGDYVMGQWTFDITPDHLYKLTREYREAWPQLPILDQMEADREQTIAFLMAGGSSLIRFMSYYVTPDDYIAPPDFSTIKPILEILDTHLATTLPLMSPLDIIGSSTTRTWALGTRAPEAPVYLVYTRGGEFDASFRPGISRLRWFDADTGGLISTTLSSQPQYVTPGDGHYFLIAD